MQKKKCLKEKGTKRLFPFTKTRLKFLRQITRENRLKKLAVIGYNIVKIS